MDTPTGLRDRDPTGATGRLIIGAALFVVALIAVPRQAEALDFNAGASLGRIMAGTVPHLAVGPQASISWLKESGFLFGMHDMFSILPPVNNDGFGVYNQTAVTIGFAWEKGSFSVGPSFSIYSMPACGVTYCGRVAGIALGGRARTDYYFAGPLGVSVSGSAEWIGGRSLVLPGGVAVMVVFGPLLRWGTK